MPFLVKTTRWETREEIAAHWADCYWTCGDCHRTFGLDHETAYCGECNLRLRRNDDVRIALANPREVVHSVTVATPEEAQEVAHVAAQGAYGRDVLVPARVVLAIADLSESGGSVGPLPDGSIITVEATMWIDLIAEWAVAAGLQPDMTEAEWQASVLAAYSAQHAREGQ